MNLAFWKASLLAAVLVGILAGCKPQPPAALPAVPAPVNLAQAESAARAVCARCHLYPEPALLETEAWFDKVLPRMRLYMGMIKPDAEQMHNPELAGDTNIFLPAPLVSEEAWSQIETFYLAKSPDTQATLERSPLAPVLALFRPEPIAFGTPPSITTLVSIDAASKSLVFIDAKDGRLHGLDGTSEAGLRAQPKWSVRTTNIITCLRTAGDARYLVGIGNFFPTDDLPAQVLRLEGSSGTGAVTLVKGDLPRTAHLEPGDFNGDGRMDFGLSVFGNLRGRFSWFEGQADGGLNEHVLLEKPGAVKSIAHDFNGDGRLDLAMLCAQAEEALFIFENDGKGGFARREVFRRPPTFGHTDFELGDFNGDGRLDFLVVNGDNADFQTQPRPYHGLRIYTGQAEGGFAEAYFFPFHGAYRALGRDFDGDGDLDIAAVAFFPDYSLGKPEPFAYLENKGGMKFEASTFASANIARWVSMDAGDLDGDGDIDLALGSLTGMPDRVPDEQKVHWKQENVSVLVLRNTKVEAGQGGKN